MFLIPDNAWEVKNSYQKGKGVFAKKDISGGTIIGDYLGKIIPIEEDDENNKDHFYAMYYSDAVLIAPDPKNNGIHLLNHSCAPNCWMYTYKGHTLYFALRHIFPGEELTVSYLLSPLDEGCKPCTHLCQCGSPVCFQTMHLSQKKYDEWDLFHEKEEKKTKPEEVVCGQDLQRLHSYPTTIPDDPIYTLFGSRIKPSYDLVETSLPSVATIRQVIRETGKTLSFVNLKLRVLGILDNLIISDNI